MFIAMHNDYANNSTTIRSFLVADEAISYAAKMGANWGVHAPSGAIIWRSEYA